jgi:uncharacterized protein (TIGR01777 family)
MDSLAVTCAGISLAADAMWSPLPAVAKAGAAMACSSNGMVILKDHGRSVNCRYDETHRREILESRTFSTLAIGKAIAACEAPPKIWINSSTATYYRHAEDHAQDEWTGEHGTGFSCDVARAWEESFFNNLSPATTRKIAIRTGMVLANEPGTVFDVLSKLTICGLGGTMGPGTQRLSWIHMEDFLRAVEFIMDNPMLDGVINLTSPEFPTNREWMRIFRETIGMPIGLPATRWMLEIGAWVLRTETELVLKSRWAIPTRLHDAGFTWRWGHATQAIADLQSRPRLDGFFRDTSRRSMGASVWCPINH